MLPIIKIALATMLALLLLPATILLRGQKRDVAIRATRAERGTDPEVVSVELRLWGRRAFFGVEKKEPL